MSGTAPFEYHLRYFEPYVFGLVFRKNIIVDVDNRWARGSDQT